MGARQVGKTWLMQEFGHREYEKTAYVSFYRNPRMKAVFEQDFIIQKGKDAVPIEVKAGTNVHSQSLKAFVDKYHPNLAVRFSLLPYKEQEAIINIPLYAVCNV